LRLSGVVHDRGVSLFQHLVEDLGDLCLVPPLQMQHQRKQRRRGDRLGEVFNL
jgi:hypothetical protein